MNEECLSCSHSKNAEGYNYCYMFAKAPNKLPCGQHDKFKEIRKATGKMILRNPVILLLMVNELTGNIYEHDDLLGGTQRAPENSHFEGTKNDLNT